MEAAEEAVVEEAAAEAEEVEVEAEVSYHLS